MERIVWPFDWVRGYGNLPRTNLRIFELLLQMHRLHDVELGAESAIPIPENSSEENPSPSVLRPPRPPQRIILTPQPSNPCNDIPNELWRLIFEFLVPPSITRPTPILVNVRGVCRLWRNIAKRLIRRTLVASPTLFDSPSDNSALPGNLARDIHLWLEEEDNFHGAEGKTDLRLVAFHLDGRYHPNQNLAKFFVSALSNCARADITIDHFPASAALISSFNACEISLAAHPHEIPLRQFSFSSMNFGIHDTLPPQFDFPWNSLRQGLPWSQLTDITLDCVLSYEDALYVLSAAPNVERVELGRLSSLGLPQVANAAKSDIVSTLRTLKINASHDLQPLFSGLDLPGLEDLQMSVHLDSISTIPKSHIVDTSLNIPWKGLKRLSLRSKFTCRRCELDKVLQRCDQLKQLTWEGDRSEFNRLPLGAPTQLQELIFISDRAGHDDFYSKIGLFPGITRLSLSYYDAVLTEDENLTNLLHITISQPITLVQLFLFLKSKARRLQSGDFCISTITQAVPESVRCDALQSLRLTLALVDAFAFPWGKLSAPELRACDIAIDRDSSLIRSRMKDFPGRSMHPDAIFTISPP